MPYVALLDERYQTTELLEANPCCGEDFCDACGDCLDCYGGDPCGRDGESGHTWYVYADKADGFRKTHPDAQAVA